MHLGAIICVPMQIPDRGILQGVVLLICALGFQRGVSWLGVKSGRFEDFTQGRMSMLVKNGMLEVDQLKDNRISHSQIFSELRSQNIFNLGEIDRVYLEACGVYSIFKAEKPRLGLPILFIDDQEIFEDQKRQTIEEKNEENSVACKNCGFVKDKAVAGKCENCGEDDWVKAII